MDTFDHLLHWKLKRGSHYFPGPDGGTCINEAAVVAAGFPYKPICFVWQMPSCFSRPICRLAMRLNDQVGDENRQRLLPYVTQLACADTRAIEKKRAAYIAQHLRGYGKHDIPFEKGLEVLEGALAIGQRADPFPSDEVKTRMEEARTTPKPPVPISAQPFFAKVKSWLTTKEMEPLA